MVELTGSSLWDRFTRDDIRFGGGGGGDLNVASCLGDKGDGGDEEWVPLDRMEGGTKEGGRLIGISSPATLRLMRCMATANSSFVRQLSRFRSTSLLRRWDQWLVTNMLVYRTYHMRASSSEERL